MSNKNNQCKSNLGVYRLFSDLNPEQQMLIAATLVERMLPNYLLFSEVTEFGDSKMLRDALNIAWEKLIVKNLKLDIEKQLEKIEINIPDISDFDIFGVYPALDCSMALSALFNGMAGDDDALMDVCKLSLSSVMKVAEQELMTQQGEISEAMLAAHELMAYEAEFLAELLETVARLEKPDKIMINQFRQRALADGVTNIGISL
jgi:uncharacterized protein YjaG (DUF416 family)